MRCRRPRHEGYVVNNQIVCTAIWTTTLIIILKQFSITQTFHLYIVSIEAKHQTKKKILPALYRTAYNAYLDKSITFYQSKIKTKPQNNPIFILNLEKQEVVWCSIDSKM